MQTILSEMETEQKRKVSTEGYDLGFPSKVPDALGERCVGITYEKKLHAGKNEKANHVSLNWETREYKSLVEGDQSLLASA